MVHRSNGWSLVRCFGRNQFPGCDGRCVQGPGTYSPRHADPRLLAIPTSCSRVAENNPNWGNLSGFAPPYSLASHCNCHCSTCVAQPIRAMRTWRHPHLPPVYHWQSLVSAACTFSFVSVLAGRTKPTTYHTTGRLTWMPSLSPPPTRRRRHLQDKAKNWTLLNKREKPFLFSKATSKGLSESRVRASVFLLASCNQKTAHTRKCFEFERRRLPSYWQHSYVLALN